MNGQGSVFHILYTNQVKWVKVLNVRPKVLNLRPKILKLLKQITR